MRIEPDNMRIRDIHYASCSIWSKPLVEWSRASGLQPAGPALFIRLEECSAMNHNIYLPDELGRWAKDNHINLSATLREALRRERDRAESVKSARGEAAIHKLTVETDNEHATVRLLAKELAWDGSNKWLYSTPDGGVFVYDGDAECLYGVEDDEPQPAVTYADEDGFAEWFRYSDPSFYLAILRALGREAVIDIGGER